RGRGTGLLRRRLGGLRFDRAAARSVRVVLLLAQDLGFLERDRVEAAEAAGEARPETRAELLEHGDQIDVAEPVHRRLVREPALAREVRALVREVVAIDRLLAAAHVEQDRAIVEHDSLADVRGARSRAASARGRP